MAGFEDLIRGALQKQGEPTPEKRGVIYNSSRQALERMLAQNSTLDADAAAAQRARLEAAISQIEKDYSAAPSVAAAPIPKSVAPRIPPEAPAPVAPASPQPVATPKPAPPLQPVPELKSKSVAPPAPQPAPPRAEPVAVAPSPAVTASAPDIAIPPQLEPDHGEAVETVRLEDYPESYKGKALKEKKPYAKMLLWAIILAGLGVTVWWAINFGPALIKEQLDGSVPNPRPTIETGSFNPGADDGWVVAFNPAEDSGNIDASGSGTADLFQDGLRNFVRLASNAGSSRNNLRIKIPRGVMLPLKGEAATIEIVLKNVADEPHQFALFCEFASMGNCGRKRFKVSKKTEAFIFDVLINDVELAEGEDAYVSINTDLSGGGKPLDLYSIRVRSSS